MADPYSAVVLAGGAARRLGGVDKASLQVGGAALLDRVLAAVPTAARVVVVGPPRETSQPVVWCREDPPGGGPVAALAAGLAQVETPCVVVLAGDLPFVTAAAVDALLTAADGHEGALLVDDNGRDQLLVGAWSTAALRAALPEEPAGARLGTVLAALDVARVRLAADGPAPWFDCDTEEDLSVARGST